MHNQVWGEAGVRTWRGCSSRTDACDGLRGEGEVGDDGEDGDDPEGRKEEDLLLRAEDDDDEEDQEGTKEAEVGDADVGWSLETQRTWEDPAADSRFSRARHNTRASAARHSSERRRANTCFRLPSLQARHTRHTATTKQQPRCKKKNLARSPTKIPFKIIY